MITPYNAQVRVLGDLFRERGWLEQMTDGGGGMGGEIWDIGGGGAGGERSEKRDRRDEKPIRRGSGENDDIFNGGGASDSISGRESGRGRGSERGRERGGGGGGRDSSERRKGNDRTGGADRSYQSTDSDRDNGRTSWEDRGMPGSKVQSTVGWVGGRGSFRVATSDREGGSTYSRYGKGKGNDSDILSSFSKIKGVKGVSKRALTLMGYAEPTQVRTLFLFSVLKYDEQLYFFSAFSYDFGEAMEFC